VLPNLSETTSDNSGQNTSKSAKNKEVTASSADEKIPPNEPSDVPNEDKANTIKVSCSDKLDNKQNNKPERDADLNEIIEAWPVLSNDIRSAILTLIRATNGEGN